MSRQKRLARLEHAAAQAARQRSPVPVSIRLVTSDGVIEPAEEAQVTLTLNLTRKDDPPARAPEWPDSGALPAPDRPPPRGQRPRRPSSAEQASAIEKLRERARLGQYVGELPVSETELAAEHRRREALRRDAELIRQTSRSVSSVPARQVVNQLAAWAWGDR